jgi:hypothetical protein
MYHEGGGEEEKKRRKGRRGRKEGGERERERRVIEVRYLYFSFSKKNELCSLLFADRGERDRGIKKTTKKIKNDVVYLFFFFWINWSYFIMSLLYWGPILEALCFYEKKFWALFKKKIRPH